MIRTTMTALALCLVPADCDAATAADDGAIVITALRTPVDATQVSSSVTVIDSQALESAQPLALSDVLDRTPSISMVRNGGYGQVTTLRIRGADPAETVMVIDGMRMTDPTTTAGRRAKTAGRAGDEHPLVFQREFHGSVIRRIQVRRRLSCSSVWRRRKVCRIKSRRPVNTGSQPSRRRPVGASCAICHFARPASPE